MSVLFLILFFTRLVVTCGMSCNVGALVPAAFNPTGPKQVEVGPVGREAQGRVLPGEQCAQPAQVSTLGAAKHCDETEARRDTQRLSGHETICAIHKVD